MQLPELAPEKPGLCFNKPLKTGRVRENKLTGVVSGEAAPGFVVRAPFLICKTKKNASAS